MALCYEANHCVKSSSNSVEARDGDECKSDVSTERSVKKNTPRNGEAARGIISSSTRGSCGAAAFDGWNMGAEPTIIREGAVPAADIWNALDIESDIGG